MKGFFSIFTLHSFKWIGCVFIWIFLELGRWLDSFGHHILMIYVPECSHPWSLSVHLIVYKYKQSSYFKQSPDIKGLNNREHFVSDYFHLPSESSFCCRLPFWLTCLRLPAHGIAPLSSPRLCVDIHFTIDDLYVIIKIFISFYVINHVQRLTSPTWMVSATHFVWNRFQRSSPRIIYDKM